jgi:chromatin remodeling complex protein RSC6
MVRASKSDKPAVAPAAAPAVASSSATLANTVVTATADKKAKKSKAVAAPLANSAAPVISTTPVVQTDAAPVESVDSPISVKMNEFGAKIQQLTSLLSAVKSEYKTLDKLIQRELKAAQKSSSKRAKRSGNRQPSGFVKPTRISDELAKFLGKNIGVEMARTEVSKEINQYIRTNNLQDKENGRKINPDSNLTALLKLKKEDELTYFNLQRYMKHHFVKAPVVVAATA